MIELSRNNIIIRNIDTTSSEFKKLTYKFSLYDKLYRKYTFSAFFQEGDDIYLPSSIGLNEITQIFPKKEVQVNFNNVAKSKNVEYSMKSQPRDDLQKQALEFLIKMKKDPETHSRFLSLATGSGKTYVTINLISKLRKKPMIIVDAIDLATQWKREFLKHTDLMDDDILILSGQESIDKEILNPQKKVYIAVHRTLGNMMTNDVNSMNVLTNKLGIGIRIFDESHVEFGNICKINAFSNVEYTLYLTATPNRSNFNDDSLYAKVFGKIPFFNGKDMSSEKYHTVILIKMNSQPTFDEKLGIRTQYGFSQARWGSYMTSSGYETLFECLIEIIEKFNLTTRNKKTAIILPTIDLIKKVKEELIDKFPEMDIGTFIGEVSKKKRDAELDKMFILTNEKIFGKGKDVKDLEIVINFVPVGSVVVTEQILGRLRNNEGKSAILFDITDIGFDECVRQQKVRKRFYKKHKTVKKIIEISKEKK